MRSSWQVIVLNSLCLFLSEFLIQYCRVFNWGSCSNISKSPSSVTVLHHLYEYLFACHKTRVLWVILYGYFPSEIQRVICIVNYNAIRNYTTITKHSSYNKGVKQDILFATIAKVKKCTFYSFDGGNHFLADSAYANCPAVLVQLERHGIPFLQKFFLLHQAANSELMLAKILICDNQKHVEYCTVERKMQFSPCMIFFIFEIEKFRIPPAIAFILHIDDCPAHLTFPANTQ